jgi:hypothetical protein
MRRFRLLTLVLLMIWTSGPVGLATSTPAPPEATPIAEPVVASYVEVGPTYEAAREEILTRGREGIALLRTGKTSALIEQFAPSLKDLISEAQLRVLIPNLESDRVHFELPQFGAIFDGHLAGDTIDGFYTQGATISFALHKLDTATPGPASSLDGRWEGQIVTGAPNLDIGVTFTTVDGALQATLDVPQQQLHDLPLSNISLRPGVPLGELSSEQALPLEPNIHSYTAHYAWDDVTIGITFVFDADGAIIGLLFQPDRPLPTDPVAGIVPSATYHLPFDGVWWVLWGGDSLPENYHAASSSQRYAYDILIWKDGGTHRGDGTANEDFWAWGQPVLSPPQARSSPCSTASPIMRLGSPIQRRILPATTSSFRRVRRSLWSLPTSSRTVSGSKKAIRFRRAISSGWPVTPGSRLSRISTSTSRTVPTCSIRRPSAFHSASPTTSPMALRSPRVSPYRARLCSNRES